MFSPKILEGYKNDLGITWSSSKGECLFYLNVNLNVIERKDLNFKFKEMLRNVKVFGLSL